jgi:hypothetical protein
MAPRIRTEEEIEKGKKKMRLYHAKKRKEKAAMIERYFHIKVK